MGMQYSDEFRAEAVRLVLDSRSSVARVAEDLGIKSWTLRGWVKEHRDGIGVRRPETLEEENRRLKRELTVLRQERDLLKKAAAYFAKEHL
jgi:transposase